MNRSIASLVVALGFASGCAATDGKAKQASASAGESQEDAGNAAAANTKVTIASVQMIEDCPHQDRYDPGPPKAAAGDEPSPGGMAHPGAAMTMPVRRGDVAGDVPPGAPDFDQCTQSRVQLALTSTGNDDAHVKIEGARLLVPNSGEKAGDLDTRKPQQWTEHDGYRAWDEVVPGGAKDFKAAYKLSVPDWSKVDAMIGRSSFGYMFVLELDVEIDGVVQTLRSPQFPREEPHIVVT